MSEQEHRAVAIVGVGAILPDAPDAPTFWRNIQQARYSITEITPDRWDPADYYDPDPKAVDKTYSKIGGWVREFEFDPFKWRMPMPPAVLAMMDDAQKWAVATCRAALLDYGYPDRALNIERTAVILGNAMAGEKHYMTALRIHAPEYLHALEDVQGFQDLPADVRQSLLVGMRDQIRSRISDITEDTMPGELSNIIAGRVANLLNLGGPNFVTDAACASSLAAIQAAAEGLIAGHFDAALTGGVDRNMGASSFVKFSKIGALSPDGSRPYAEGANGFVMGEGAAVFLLKRLRDAERDGDAIYAVIRGIGGSSDGKGKGITAPNPIGQQRAVERAWANAGLSPATAGYIEGHGTSTRVGDVAEVESIHQVFAPFDLPVGSIPLGSVKSNFGHLKGAAGAAGLLKAAYALRDKVIPPNANFERPNSQIAFDRMPFWVNTKLIPWDRPAHGVRRAGISSFGFGGTNFHMVVEEHVPGLLTSDRSTFQAAKLEGGDGGRQPSPVLKVPYRGALVLGAADQAGLRSRLDAVLAAAQQDPASFSTPAVPDRASLQAPERLAIDFESADELLKRGEKAVRAFESGAANVWKPLSSQGIFRGSGKPGKIAFLFPGQGSQYVNMLRELCELDPVVAATFREADEVMTPLLGHPLSSYIFVDSEDKDEVAVAENKLKDTTITQPAVLTVNVALARLLMSYGVEPDMVIGHSLGEYAALVVAGVLSFAEALQVVSARGREMSKVSMEDNGCMAAVLAPLEEVERILATIEGYVVLANINSRAQVVIGGATAAVDQAIAAFQAADYRAVKIPVSHAFHTQIVAPASEPLKRVIGRMNVRPPALPIVANITGDLYPRKRSEIIDTLGQQVASPVQFVKGVETLYREGVRIFVEVGPKRVLTALAEDILGDREDVTVLFTNHPRKGTLPSLSEALCGLYAAGLGAHSAPSLAPEEPRTGDRPSIPEPGTRVRTEPSQPKRERVETTPLGSDAGSGRDQAPGAVSLAEGSSPDRFKANLPGLPEDRYLALGKLFADFLEQGQRIYAGAQEPEVARPLPPVQPDAPVILNGKLPLTGSVVISGAALGLPGQDGQVFDDRNIDRILKGEQFIDLIPYRLRTQMAGKRITRLVKRESGASFEVITDPEDTIKLAGQRGRFDLTRDFGVDSSRVEALDISTQLAIAAGVEALRDAGIPLAMRYRTTSKNTWLPDRWMLPEALADETGVIFCSAFPGLDRMADEVTRYESYRSLNEQLDLLQQLRTEVKPGQNGLGAEIDRRMRQAQDELDQLDYGFDRRFIFRVLAMGHSQFAEYIGARGPNTHVNAACATTTHAVAVAEDWIRAGRCRRVIVIAGDDVTGENLMPWIGAGLLATGATTTEARLDKAALPFDVRRHGTIVGMGAAALVVEAEDAVQERGMRGICELLSSQIANSAFHGTRLDVDHICEVMDRLVGQAEARFGLDRQEMAPQMVFISHETYTPARGGSAAAEIHALRQTFGDRANRVVIANTKGYTGHSMGVGIEDVLAVKALEFETVPPVANILNDFQPDPELGDLRLSHGGHYPVQYALRLGAGFGSQIAMTLLRRIPGSGTRVERRDVYDRWLSAMAGYDRADLQVEYRTLRIQDAGPPLRSPARSAWQFGSGPTAWVSESVMPVHAQPVASLESPAAGAQPGVPASPAPLESVPVASAPVVEAPAAGGADPIVERVLALVSEKTGYPPDMLDVDLDLEADLGIDTVKQAEVFATIRETYGIPRREDLKLRDYNTLAKVVGFVRDSLGDRAPASPAPLESVPVASAPVVEAPAAGGADPIVERVLALVSEKTGYPPDMLDVDLDLEADLGIDTVKQAEVFATIRETYGIPRREDLKLRDYNTLAKVVGFVRDSLGDRALASPAPQESVPVAVAPVVEAPAAGGADSIMERVLALVSEKTGYPPDMLDVDLDLEADLGIDTVKQAEVFATIRETYGIPRREDLKLRDYNTLAKVVGFVRDSLGDRAPAPPAPQESIPVAVAPAVEVPAAGGTDPIVERVLALVSEKTGYPPDMLDVDLDLEADLGIDTVKQAEVFATIRETYGIPRREDLKLRDYNTLAKVAGFVRDSLPQGVGETAAPASAVDAPEAERKGERAVRRAAAEPAPDLHVTDSLPRRVPMPMLRPGAELCKPTGVSFGPGSRVVIVSDSGKVAKYLGYRLRARKAKALVIKETAPQAAQAQIEAWLAEGPIAGVYFLSALDVEPTLDEMDLERWHSEQDKRVRTLYAVMRALPDEPFLVCGTHLGGLHGYSPKGATAPLGGAVVGFAKAYARERPQALVKAVDWPVDADERKMAEQLVTETLSDPGAVEIGYATTSGGDAGAEQRYGVGLVERPVDLEHLQMELGPESVFLISGGAGGITVSVVIDLARASGGTFYLTGRTPMPDPADPDLARLNGDLKLLKRDIAKRIKDSGVRPTPVMVDREVAALERAASILSVIDEVERAGGKATYRACDVVDSEAVSALVAEIAREHGRIDVLIHAAGIERSHFLPDKDPAEFDQILNIKADGFFNLLRASRQLDLPVKAVVAFSSIAGRFGNAGQTDYSAANDLLCKMVSWLRGVAPETRAIAIDWSAWAGIGMASRGSIPEMMNRAGIEMLDPLVAAPVVRREIVAGGGEVLAAGALGTLLDPRDPDGGLDLASVNAQVQRLLAGGQAFPLISQAIGIDANHGLAFEVELDPRLEPFLYDHALDEIPLLPGVMGIEGFAEVATLIASGLGVELDGTLSPRFCVRSIEDVRFESPLKFYRQEPRKMIWRATVMPEGDCLVAQVTLESVRELKAEGAQQRTRHFSGRVFLELYAAHPREGSPIAEGIPSWNGAPTVNPEAIYRVYFHGPAFQVLEAAQAGGGRVIGKFRANLPPITSNARSTLLDPRLIELCLQTAGVWEIGKTGTLALPTAIERVVFYPPQACDLTGHTAKANGVPVYAEIEPRSDLERSSFNARVVDEQGNLYLQLYGYRTTSLPDPIGDDLIAPLRTAFEG